MIDSPCCRSTDGPSPSTFMGFGKIFKTVAAPPGLSPKRIRKIRRKLGISGKQIKRKLGLTGVSSAAGVSSDNSSIYGPTGSIVGRY